MKYILNSVWRNPCWLLLIIFCLNVESGCKSRHGHSFKSRETRRVLLDAIDGASEIFLSEHSSVNVTDLDGEQEPVKEIKVLSLTKQQIKELKSIVDQYSTGSDTETPSLGICRPRHTVRFVAVHQKSDLLLQIDFKSNLVQGGVFSECFDNLRYSRVLIRQLDKFFVKSGFDTSQFQTK